jgi:cell division protein FtsL
MNTATRVVGSQLEIQKIKFFTITQQGFWMGMLILGLLFSAFSIIYVKDLQRRLFIQDQTIRNQNIAANDRWGKLLLAQSTLAAQARVQSIAENKLGMISPSVKDVQIIKDITESD